MYRQPQRLAFLDSIRGLAALAVLLSHSFAFAWPPLVSKTVGLPWINMPFNGKAAVAMFFVLSGFVLSRPYLVSTEPGIAPRKVCLPTFYLRRFTRIWLPWFFAFCLSALAQVLVFRKWTTTPAASDWLNGFWHTRLTLANFLRQCIFIEHDAKIQLLNQDWSLDVELKASVMLPLFVLLCVTRWSWALLVASALLFFLLPSGHYYSCFILGILLAQRGNGLMAWLQPKPAVVKVGLLFLGVMLYETLHFGLDWLGNRSGEKYYWLGTGLGCVLIVLVSLASRRLQAALHLSPLLFLGRISYSLYLLQFIVILCVLPPWIHFLNTLGIYRPVWLLPLNFIASVSVTVGISTLAYHFVEKPCIQIGHVLSTKWQAMFLKR